MWTKSTKSSKTDQSFHDDDLRKLEQVQQIIGLPDDVAAALRQQRLAARRAAKATSATVIAPEDSSLSSTPSPMPMQHKLMVLVKGLATQTQGAIAGSLNQAKALAAKLPTRQPVRPRSAKVVAIGVVSLGAIAVAVPSINHLGTKPTTTAPVLVPQPQPQNDVAQTNKLWLVQSENLAKQRRWKDALVALLNVKSGSTTSKPLAQSIDRILTQHFRQMDEQYRSTVDARGINKLRDDTRIAPTTLSKNDPIDQKIEAKVKAHRDEWHRNETYLLNAKKQANQWNFSALDTADAELKKIKLLGKDVKSDSSYWNKKIKPVKDAIDERRAALRVPQTSSYDSPNPPDSDDRPYIQPYSPPVQSAPRRSNPYPDPPPAVPGG